MAVIDAHAHIYPDKIAAAAVDAVGDFYEVNMFGDGTAAGLLSAKDRSPITHFLVHSVATSVHAVTAINNAIAQACQAHTEFIGFAAMHQDFEDPATELQRAVDLGLHGVKLHPDTQKVNMDDPRLMEVYAICEEMGLPVVIHTGDYRYDFSHPRRLVNILKAFPDLVVDAAHFGYWPCFDVGYDILHDIARPRVPRPVQHAKVPWPAPHRRVGAHVGHRPHHVRQRLPHVGPGRRMQQAYGLRFY